MGKVNNIHTTAGSFKKEIGWYRKLFLFQNPMRERSGYKKIVYEITDFVNYGGDNLLSVKADARQAEGWFYEGGGIYRHVYLLKTEQEHIDNTFVWCDVDLTHGSAMINVQTELDGCENGFITTKIIAPDGSIAVQGKMDVEYKKSVMQLQVENCKLWDTKNPNLYQAVTKLFVDGIEKDEYTTLFGIRNIQFDCEKGFILNGIQTKIKGVCAHQNHGGLGTALPDEVYRYRIKLLKEMGANAYRCAHYPPTPELLDICDEEGILVMDETRLLSSERGDLEQLESMVKRDRNHPSVILYSLGNEEAQSQAIPQGARIAKTMMEHIKKLDPHTPVTMALIMWDLKNKIPINDIGMITPLSKQLDVAGFNYHHHQWAPYHKEFPDQPMICTEQGTFKSTRGCYKTDPKLCHLSITDKTADSYMKGAVQWHVCREDFMSGFYLWTGFDYYGEPTPYAWTAISSQFGAMDICGYPKDFYYYYKSWWTDETVLHLFPHWNLNEGDITDVYAFSNCDEAKLFVNGESLGKKKIEIDDYLVWENINYIPGELYSVTKRFSINRISKPIYVSF